MPKLTPQQRRVNVLFIAVDDLRPALGCYGVEQARTPQMDAFAKTGRLFQNQYAQVPTCGASRYSLLTSTQPRKALSLNNHAARMFPRGDSKAARSMPELFRKNGYRTVCIGKVSHMPDGKVFKYNGSGDGHSELPDAWDEFLTPYGDWGYGHGAFFAYGGGRHREDKAGYEAYCEFPDVADNELPDGMMADTAIKRLKEFSKSGEPFFMGLGFYKPHLPFVAPKKYRDPYDGVEIPSANAMRRGDTKQGHRSDEFYRYKEDRPFKRPAKGETLAEPDAQEIRRAYLACVSYVDAQIGRVFQALEEAGLDKNTVVVLWGDHGWHLGENNVWGKHTPLDKALRSAFMMRVPGQKKPGIATESLAAALDIYPTLVDLCELENRQTDLPLDGVSLRSVLDDPNAQVRDEVLSFWKNATSMISGNQRFIVSQNKDDTYRYELYDHKSDPGELKNIAGNNEARVKELRRILEQRFPAIVIQK